MSEQPFRFKQFSIQQDQCAMKIGTDGVLLGAWAAIEHAPFSILDIGAGTGVISLMLAQRCNAETIEAIEIDDKAYEQCVENFEASDWSDRLFCYHASVQEFAHEIDDTYDLIVSNPPFYSEDYKTENKSRDIARFQDSMPFEHLIKCVSKLLSENGRFCTIIPFKEENRLKNMAKKQNLYANKIVRVKGTPTSSIKRSLMEFSFHEKRIEISELAIEMERHAYTKDYINLTKDFYLNL